MMRSSHFTQTALFAVAGLMIGTRSGPASTEHVHAGHGELASAGFDSHWSSPFPSLDGYVMALAAHGDTLYAGGYFRTAGSEVVNHIARWDGRRWSSLGSGMNEAVYALAVDPNGILYAGGMFTTAGGIPSPRIARWNGEEWSSLGKGMSQLVQTLALDKDGSLYAGGAFTRAGDVEANYIARWDGVRWHGLGDGTDHNVFAIAPAGDGSVYAGGGFMTAGNLEVHQVAKWDGERWHPLGEGMSSRVWGFPVRALALADDGTLYAGGDFDIANGSPAKNIARWNGYRWSPVGAGMNGVVGALILRPDGELYAGGYFTRAGHVEANHVARWDGRNWHALGSGTDESVAALALDPSGMLHVGGSFYRAGPLSARSLSCWLAESTVQDVERGVQVSDAPSLEAPYPNPFAYTTTLRFTLSQPSHARLTVYDALGRERLTLVDGVRSAGKHSVEVEASNLASGVYLYRLEAGPWMRSGTVHVRK